MKHTPGPWLITSHPTYDFTEIRNPESNTQICELPNYNELEEVKANARLIAAAPELLKQLEYTRDILRELPHLQNPTIDLLAQQIEETLNSI